MPTESKRKRGCFRAVLFTVGALVFLNYILGFLHTRPEKLLSRHLKIERTEEITKLKSKYIGGLDSTTHIYVEGNPVLLSEIISSNRFKPSSNSYWSQLDFDDAPALPSGLIFYEKIGKSPIQYIGISPDKTSLWYVALQY